MNYHKDNINKNQPTIKISLRETQKIKIILNNSKERDKNFIHQRGNNNIKNYNNEIAKKYNEKTYINNLSKTQSYFKISQLLNKRNKIRKLYFFLNMIALFISFNFDSGECNQKNILFKFSEITLKTKGTGNIKLLSEKFLNEYTPYKLYLDDSLLDIVIDKNGYNFDSNYLGTINTFRIIWNVTILKTDSMFNGCNNIIELDLSKFNTSLVNDMSYMFQNCKSLTSLNISNFDASLVNDMSYMFYNCSSLISLGLENFDTSRVKNMSNMFYNCTSLISLNVFNFNTSMVNFMNNMFEECRKLLSLDIYNFDTSKVRDMNGMFSNCKNLNSLDLTNFDTSLVTNMTSMFHGCTSIKSLNISNFDTSKVKDMTNNLFHI